MMNSTNFFANPLQTVNFLSIFGSIHILNDFFYDDGTLTIGRTPEPIIIINTLCNYLNDGDNNATAIIALGRKLLENSDLYGSKEYETINLVYVNAMMDYIISSFVFAEFRNTFGYLSAIVRSTNNLTLSSVKQKIVKDLGKRKYLNQNGSFSELTNLTIKRVTERLIFPLFPQPTNDMRIVDVDYIYAHAGLMLARSLGIDPHDISFDELKIMSQTVEQSVIQGRMNETALQIFQLPALLYYTHKRKEIFRERKIQTLITDSTFWYDALHLLFFDLDVSFRIITKLQETNPEYQFQMALSDYKNRTRLAEDTLRKMCPLGNENDYAKEVNEYKYHNDNYYCKTDKSQKLPDINKLFSEQNENIANRFSQLEKVTIQKTFTNDSKKLIDQRNVRVFRAVLYDRPSFLAYGGANIARVDSSIDLFAIIRNRSFDMFTRIELEGDLHALIRNESGIFLISIRKLGTTSFLQKIGLDPHRDYDVVKTWDVLKFGYEKFDTFVEKIVKQRRDIFLEMLQAQGYDSTKGEKVVNFLKSLIPFYSCVQAIKTGKVGESIFSCSLDILFMIPVVGHGASIGLKFANAALKPLLLSLGTTVKTFIVRQSIGLALKTGIRVFASEMSPQISKIITRSFFKNIGITVFNAVDPGIQVGYYLGKGGSKALIRSVTMIARKVPSLGRVPQIIRESKQIIRKKVDNFKSYNVFVNSISGEDGYGTKYFKLDEQTVELKRVIGFKSEQPVVLTVDKKSRWIYQKIDWETRKPDGEDLVMINDVLVKAPPPLSVRLKNIKSKGLNGGRQLPDKRTEYFEAMNRNKKEALNKLKTHMDENEARKMLDSYVLEDEGRTYKDFVDEYILQSKLPDWSEDFKLNDDKNYESLRFDSHLEDLTLNGEIAAKRITDFYGMNYIKDIIQIDPKKLFQFYADNNLHSVVTFNDYYALANFISGGSPRILLDTLEACRMKSAIYRLALRQVDNPLLAGPRKIYGAEIRKIEDLPELQEGLETSVFKMAILNFEKSVPAKFLVQNKEANNLKVFYEFELDRSYLAVDTDRILPTIEREVVFLPGLRFIVQRVDQLLAHGNIYLKVYLKNIPVSKSKWLARLTNNMKLMEDWENFQMEIKSIGEFDLDLLQ